MARYKILLDSAQINCKSNSILSSQVYTYLEKNEHEIVKNPSEADFILINTCGFNIEQENISTSMYREYEHKKKNGAMVVSIGCLNKINKGLRNLFSDVIFVSSPAEFDRLFKNKEDFASTGGAYLVSEKIDELYANDRRGIGTLPKISTMIFKNKIVYQFMKNLTAGNSRIRQVLDEVCHMNKFYVQIGSGCASNCSYCILKKAKGNPTSRSISQVLQDIRLAHEPDKNLCLVADDCGSYGFDADESIFTLIRAISDEYPGLGVDLCYVNACWIQKYANGYMDMIKNSKINSINISLQSGSDRLIKRMNRNYSISEVMNVIKKLREASPQTMIWTHILIGFPGEDEDDFKNTLNILDAFDFAYPFIYSDRDGTAATTMKDKVPDRVKVARRRRLRMKGYKNVLRQFLHDCIRS